MINERDKADVAPHWLRLAAEIRPMLAHLPGVDGDYLDYLVDQVGKRNGADTDEYRALQSIALDVRRIRALDAQALGLPEGGAS